MHTSSRIGVMVTNQGAVRTAEALMSQLERLGHEPVLIVSASKPITTTSPVPQHLVEVLQPPRNALQRLLDALHGLLANNMSRLFPGNTPANDAFGLPSSGWRRAVLRAVRRSPFRVSAATLNSFLTWLFARLPHNQEFPVDRVLVVTHPEKPRILCRRHLSITAVVESWDHPVRRVAGFSADGVIAWNRSLADDWLRFQGGSYGVLAPPIRLAYALNSVGAFSRAVLEAERRVIVPVATSSWLPEWFDDELRLLEVVCGTFATTGWTVRLKPKPMTPPEDLDRLRAIHESVDLSPRAATTSAVDYDLTDEYNRARLREMREADLVLSTVTTYGLDAAAAGLPVVQLDLRQVAEVPQLAGAATNHHLVSYLYRPDLPAYVDGRSLTEIAENLAATVGDGAVLKTAGRRTAALRAWLMESRSSSGIIGDPPAYVSEVARAVTRQVLVPSSEEPDREA